MRHGYPAAMNNGAPITILKRGPSGLSQTDSQVINIILFYVFNYIILILEKYKAYFKWWSSIIHDVWC
jgi:hypothetical protein